MKRIRLSALLTALLLLLSLGSPAFADAVEEPFWDLAYDVNYDVYVKSSDGLGLNVRYGPGTNYELSYWQDGMGPIPDGTKVHILKECTSDYGNKWGLISEEIGEYDYYGWIYLPETVKDRPIVSWSVDYMVYSNSADGLGLNLRKGPGSNYDLIGVSAIPDNTQLHVTQESDSEFGNRWGYVEYNGSQGWIYLPETSAQPLPSPEPTPEAAEPTPAPTPEATPEPSEEPAPAPSGVTEPGQSASVYTPLMLAMAGICVLCVALAAAVILLLLKRKK